MARKFLYLVAFLIVLVIAGLLAFRLFGTELLRWRLVPDARFEAQAALDNGAYAGRDMWIARPDIANNPARWTPPGYGVPPSGTAPAAVFFIHPTSFLDQDRWNAPLDNQEANDRATIFLRGQASAFNEAGDVWAPRYRQATFGAFLTNASDAQRALGLAYGDVLRSFDAFVAQIDRDRPIILAGHSQGALHLTHLLQDRIAGRPIARRIVAAYVVGWPISRETDLPALGLPECSAATQAGCILSWLTFSDPADPGLILDTFDATTGFNGRPRAGTAMVCTNPLTGTAGAAAPATANNGTLIPAADLGSAALAVGRVPAACRDRGILSIGEDPPALGPYVLPGNNYHVYDYSLFWTNVRQDAARRLATWQAAR